MANQRWWLMELGIGWIAVAQWVAALPGAVGRAPAFGIAPMLLAMLGIVLIGLMRMPLRWCGSLIVLLAVAPARTVVASGGRDAGQSRD